MSKKEIDNIKNQLKKVNSQSAEANKIMQEINKCFYAEHKPNEESEMVKMIQLKNGENRERKGLHASSVIKDEMCYRAAVLSLFFKADQNNITDLNLLKIFEEGNAIHEKYQRLFIRGGLGTPSDMDVTRFDTRYDISYTPDAIITIDGIKYICEIKSMNTFQYQKTDSHISGHLQCLLYEWLTGIHNGFVLMDDKNTQDFKIEMVNYDPEKIKPILIRMNEIQRMKNEFKETKKPVKRCMNCDSADCEKAQECYMRSACWNVGIGRIKL